jgi:hypothetical protein
MSLGELSPYREPVPRTGAVLLLEANVGKPLLDVLRELSLDPDKQAAFDDNPARYLAQFGYEDVEADHLSEAFSLVADTLPPDAAQAVAATAPAPPDVDDGSGGAPDTTINPDEDTFGGVDESFDTAALNGDDVVDIDDLPGVDGADGTDGADGNGGYGTGELALDDLDAEGFAADGADGGDTVAFGVGSESTLADDDGTGLGGDDGPPFLGDDAEAFALDAIDDAGNGDGDSGLGDDAFDDTADLGDGAAADVVDDVDDGPVDDVSFDDFRAVPELSPED